MNLDGPTLRLARDARAAGEALAHRPAFAIGPLGVHPSTCRIRWGDGPDRPVQPLAMRVLTALAEAQGETYSRDDLLVTCWNARIVGDDAIHRVISQLRRDLRAVAGDAVRIDTIARVGYRLRVIDGPNAAEERAGDAFAVPSTAARPNRRWLWPGVTVAAAAMAAAAALMLPSAPAAGTTIAVEPVAGGTAGLLTDDLTDELASLASPIVGLTFVEAGQGSGRPDLILRVSLGRSASGPDSHVRLVDGETGAVVWSRAFEARDPSLAALRERIAYSVGGLIHCGLDRSATAFSEPVSRRLYLNACDALNEADWPRARAYGERIAALRPEVAASWACLAVTTIGSSPVVRGANDTVNQRAMVYARRALAVDPHSGMAYVALAVALDRQGRSSFFTLEKGRELDPDHAPVQAFYSVALMRAGYVDAAVEPMQRAAALQPDSKSLYDLAFYTMLLSGRRAEAEALNRRMQLLWVEDPLLPAQHTALVSHAPDPIAALKLLGEGASAAGPSAPTLELLRWRAAPGSYQWARFDRMAEHEFASDSDAAWNTTYLAGRMGDQRRALAWLERAPADRSGAWTVLFSPEAAALRRDPRFFAKMAELGLVDFWQARGKWPDFCSDHGLRYDCRQEARRMIAQAPGNGRLSELSPV